MSFLSRWRPGHLLLAWIGYWILLLAVTVGPALPAILRATRAGNHGEINLSVGDGGISLTVREMGRLLWSSSIGLLPAALWIALPPLVLWLIWLNARSARDRAFTSRLPS